MRLRRGSSPVGIRDPNRNTLIPIVAYSTYDVCHRQTYHSFAKQKIITSYLLPPTSYLIYSHFPVSAYLSARLCAASTISLSNPISFSRWIAFRLTAGPGFSL